MVDIKHDKGLTKSIIIYHLAYVSVFMVSPISIYLLGCVSTTPNAAMTWSVFVVLFGLVKLRKNTTAHNDVGFNSRINYGTREKVLPPGNLISNTPSFLVYNA
jgi:hypothetical protein